MVDFLDIDINSGYTEEYYYRKNKRCIFDPIRKMLIIESPEEIIRQKFIRYLIDKLKVPESKIGVEVPMSDFKKYARGKADIIIYGEDEDGYHIPMVIIECKAPDVPLTDEVWFQAYKYDNILGTGLIIITNGKYTYGALWDEDDEQYYFIEELPKYKQLLSQRGFGFIPKETIEEAFESRCIGEDTDENLYPLIINLMELIFERSNGFDPINIGGLKIIKDGYRYASFGNAAGGDFSDNYKYFLIEDAEGENQIISLSIFSLLKCIDHPIFGNRNGYTTLVVGIDDFEEGHNSLQLNIDKYTKIEGNKYTICMMED